MTEHLVKAYEQELVRLRSLVATLGELTGEQLDAVIGSIEQRDPEAAARVLRHEPEADRLAREIDTLAIRILALHHPVGGDLRAVLAVLWIGDALKRICDHAEDLAQRAVALDTARIEPTR